MEQKSSEKRLEKLQIKQELDELVDIFGKEDGKSFEEKKEEALQYLKTMEENILLGEQIIRSAEREYIGRNLRKKFWDFGTIVQSMEGIKLRNVEDSDKDRFLMIQRENTIMPSMFRYEVFRERLWKEHISVLSLVCSILKDGKYVGYCGVKKLSGEEWELSMELLRKWTNQGIGYQAMTIFLNEIKMRMDVSEFRIQVDPSNYASQRLVEKLGAVPNGVGEFILHGEEETKRCEEKNMHLIDDRIRAVAEKFQVEPRLLLSHVLEYKLEWTKI